MAEIERLRVEHIHRRRREEYIRDVMLGAIDAVRLRSACTPSESALRAEIELGSHERSNTL